MIRASSPQSFFNQVAGSGISDKFKRLLVPVDVRMPVEEFHEWHGQLQQLGNLGEAGAEFSKGLNAALRLEIHVQTNPWPRAVALITLIQTTIAARQSLDRTLLELYGGKDAHKDAIGSLLSLLKDLYVNQADACLAGPAAFYRLVRAAALLSGFDDVVDDDLGDYLRWLQVEERAMAAQVEAHKAGAPLARPNEHAAALSSALREIDACLQSGAAAAVEFEKHANRLSKEAAMLRNGGAIDQLRETARQIADAAGRYELQFARRAPPTRVLHYLRNLLAESAAAFGTKTLNSAVTPAPQQATEKGWNLVRLQFGGLPHHMSLCGVTGLSLMLLAVMNLLILFTM
jgi:hypothetical protein